jgi:hypothetical protein
VLWIDRVGWGLEVNKGWDRQGWVRMVRVGGLGIHELELLDSFLNPSDY